MSTTTPRPLPDVPDLTAPLLAAMARTTSASARAAYAIDLWLVTHPEVHVSTDEDYPGWIPGGTA